MDYSNTQFEVCKFLVNNVDGIMIQCDIYDKDIGTFKRYVEENNVCIFL